MLTCPTTLLPRESKPQGGSLGQSELLQDKVISPSILLWTCVAAGVERMMYVSVAELRTAPSSAADAVCLEKISPLFFRFSYRQREPLGCVDISCLIKTGRTH